MEKSPTPLPTPFYYVNEEKMGEVLHPDWLEEPRPDWSILAGNSGSSIVLFGPGVLRSKSVLYLGPRSGSAL